MQFFFPFAFISFLLFHLFHSLIPLYSLPNAKSMFSAFLIFSRSLFSALFYSLWSLLSQISSWQMLLAQLFIYVKWPMSRPHLIFVVNWTVLHKYVLVFSLQRLYNILFLKKDAKLGLTLLKCPQLDFFCTLPYLLVISINQLTYLPIHPFIHPFPFFLLPFL